MGATEDDQAPGGQTDSLAVGLPTTVGHVQCNCSSLSRAKISCSDDVDRMICARASFHFFLRGPSTAVPFGFEEVIVHRDDRSHEPGDGIGIFAGELLYGSIDASGLQ